MTAAEFNTEFNLAYNNLTNNEGKVFSAKEKSLLLTIAQDDIFNKYKQVADNEEGNSHYLAPIKKVTNPALSTVTYSSYPNARYAALPIDHLYTIGEQVNIVFNSGAVCYAENDTKTIYKLKLITEDYYAMNINNPFKKPYDDLVWKFYSSTPALRSDIVILIGDSTYNISSYWMSYYKTYQPIIVPYAYPVIGGSLSIRGKVFSSNTSGLTSEFDDFVHPEIVERAAQIGSKYSKDQLAYQLKQMDNINTNKIN